MLTLSAYIRDCISTFVWVLCGRVIRRLRGMAVVQHFVLLVKSYCSCICWHGSESTRALIGSEKVDLCTEMFLEFIPPLRLAMEDAVLVDFNAISFPAKDITAESYEKIASWGCCSTFCPASKRAAAAATAYVSMEARFTRDQTVTPL
ncbi:hypothetical protein Ddye_027378 [Dipteronia dyeriana]|uniref:Uncharacterized protein n=1 Tax=Dipteronia dyeriana TaxID=168575 RepID=A0AAD9TPG5_9ROSI|nr:hypothetical protein Ddye_027378 [Dipteronia dyeriana]